MSIIKIDNLTFNYEEKLIFLKLNLQINENKWTTIVGNNGVGKSTLIKLILGLLPSNNNITVNNIIVNEENKNKVRKDIMALFDNPDNYFIADIVEKELSFNLENLKVSQYEQKRRIDNIVDKLGIEHLLNRNINTLSGGEKQLIALASALVCIPKILFLDESLTMIDGVKLRRIWSFLKKYCNENKITLINITTNVNDVMFGDEILIMSDETKPVLITKEDIKENHKLFLNASLELPFIPLLSSRLKFYDLVNEIQISQVKLVNELWK